MAYCSKCGKELKDNAVFCGNCGNQINKTTQSPKSFELFKGNFDFKSILIRLKNYFAHFYVDYNSKAFKFAMALLLGFGVGEFVFSLFIRVMPSSMDTIVSKLESLIRLGVSGAFFGIFSFFVLRLKPKETFKKSNFLMIFWIVTLALNLLVFIADLQLYKYIIFDKYASLIVEVLIVISTALLLLKNRPKYPIELAISCLFFALMRVSLWSIKIDISSYKFNVAVDKTKELFGNTVDIIYSLRNIFLVLVFFIVVYILPKKISKILVYIFAAATIVLNLIKTIEDFRFTDIFSFILQFGIVAMFVLFAFSCSRDKKYDYIVTGDENLKKRTLKISLFSIGSVSVIIISYLLVSAIICSAHINSGLKKWKDDIINAQLTTDSHWDAVERDIFKYNCDAFASQFVDEYYVYKTIKENRYQMEKISKCYYAFTNGKVNDDIIDEYSYIYEDESWKNDSILSVYYEQYEKMKPDKKDVSVSAYVDVDKGKIEITVKNDNLMPISKCTVDCNFTILFIESGSYSSNEYGRGSKTIEVEDIAGKSEKTETITFNPDDYYDSYGSYIIATLMDQSVTIVSIE